ncbi:MAG TPA: enoyl-CoA hydratase/isomerase family protein, partial [Streptosporangiaceae bacterium]|nr:enoyl-CoA hydratase/isomerase family protein [Streptosporangiaceae bacterium]
MTTDVTTALNDQPARDPGSLAADAAVLAAVVGAAEKILGDLPPVADRDSGQRAVAARAHRSARVAREEFLRARADDVYDELTDQRRTRVRVTPLLFAAADRFPGLAPTAAQLSAETGLLQRQKEGWEINQGIVLRALLSSPSAGRHLIDTMLTPDDRSRTLLDKFRQTGRLELGKVTVERVGPAAHLTVHNADCLNAEDNGLAGDMDAAVDLALLDPEVKVGVLRGGIMTHPRYAGRRIFSAGINLSHLHQGRISYTDFLIRRELGYIHKIYRGILADDPAAWPHPYLQKPWLAVVDGFAIGGGAQLLLVFDHVIATADAYFSLPAAQEGIVPGAGNLRLNRMTGGRLARRIVLGGCKVRAAEREGRLVFDEIVEPEGMEAAVAAAVERL